MRSSMIVDRCCLMQLGHLLASFFDSERCNHPIRKASARNKIDFLSNKNHFFSCYVDKHNSHMKDTFNKLISPCQRKLQSFSSIFLALAQFLFTAFLLQTPKGKFFHRENRFHIRNQNSLPTPRENHPSKLATKTVAIVFPPTRTKTNRSSFSPNFFLSSGFRFRPTSGSSDFSLL